MRTVSFRRMFPDKLFVELWILVFLIAGLSANVRGQDLKECNAGDKGGTVKTKSKVQVMETVPEQGEPVLASDLLGVRACFGQSANLFAPAPGA